MGPWVGSPPALLKKVLYPRTSQPQVFFLEPGIELLTLHLPGRHLGRWTKSLAQDFLKITRKVLAYLGNRKLLVVLYWQTIYCLQPSNLPITGIFILRHIAKNTSLMLTFYYVGNIEKYSSTIYILNSVWTHFQGRDVKVLFPSFILSYKFVYFQIHSRNYSFLFSESFVMS